MSHRNLSELLAEDPDSAAADATYKAVVVAYHFGNTVQDICDTFGVSRTDVALILVHSGVRRGMDPPAPTAEDVKILYSLLYAAQLDIQRLRAELREL